MIRATIIYLTLGLPLLAQAQNHELLSLDGWEFEKTKYGVDVYGKNISGYEIKAFRVSGLIDATVESVFKVVMDIEGYDQWYPNCKRGEVLDQPSELEQYRRIEFKLPWPFENRDAVNKLSARKEADSIWIEIEDKSDYVPNLKNVYRIGKTEGYWVITKENETQARLTYSAIGEPGGIPKWIVNIFLFDSPLEAINNIRKVIKLPRYVAD